MFTKSNSRNGILPQEINYSGNTGASWALRAILVLLLVGLQTPMSAYAACNQAAVQAAQDKMLQAEPACSTAQTQLTALNVELYHLNAYYSIASKKEKKIIKKRIKQVKNSIKKTQKQTTKACKTYQKTVSKYEKLAAACPVPDPAPSNVNDIITSLPIFQLSPAGPADPIVTQGVTDLQAKGLNVNTYGDTSSYLKTVFKLYTNDPADGQVYVFPNRVLYATDGSFGFLPVESGGQPVIVKFKTKIAVDLFLAVINENYNASGITREDRSLIFITAPNANEILFAIGHDPLGDYFIDGTRLQIGLNWVLGTTNLNAVRPYAELIGQIGITNILLGQQQSYFNFLNNFF